MLGGGALVILPVSSKVRTSLRCSGRTFAEEKNIIINNINKRRQWNASKA
jgi:hypothetical protein